MSRVLIPKFERLYGEDLAGISRDFLFSELLETRSPEFGWVIKPHKHPNLCQLFFIREGAFWFEEANLQKRLEAPCLLFIPPDTVHGFQFEDTVRGRIVSMSFDVVLRVVGSLGLPSDLFSTLQLIVLKEISLLDLIERLLEQLDEELFHERSHRAELLQAYLNQLFIQLTRLWQEADLQEHGRQASDYFHEFMRLVRQSETSASVDEFATQLGISAVHLNRVCRQMASQSAGMIVQRHLVQQAKNYLLHTNYGIAEIAYILNFEYPNYFARFFRRHTGMSPKDYRQRSIAEKASGESDSQ